ncbi:hypothetical protein, partial [Parasphingorhabdus sp.]
MLDNRNFRLLAGLGLAVATILPAMASHARDTERKFNSEWSAELASEIKAQVIAGLAEGAIGMEQGADEMLRGADELEAYADRLEQDAEFRKREAARQSEWKDEKITAQ